MKFIWFALAALLGAATIVAFFVPAPYLFLGEAFLLGAAVLVAMNVRTLAEEDRRSAQGERQLRNILFNLEDAIIVYNKDFTIIFFNPAAERLFRLEAATVVGHTSTPQDLEQEGWRFLTQVMFPSIAPTVVARTPAGEYPQVLEISFTDPFSELRVSTLPLGDKNGRLDGFMKVVRDRTREVSLVKAKGEFLTIAAHQLRTPTTEVLWAVESLAGRAELRGEAQATAETALRSARTLAKILEDVLNVTRIEEGRFGYTFEAVDVSACIKQVLADMATLARQLGIKVYFEQPKVPLPRAIMDTQKFSLALSNIVENAIRYNVEKGEVTVRVEKLENKPLLDIQVKDTGIGISAVDLQKLFGKFFRSEGAMKAYTDGSGLGLYIARNIAQAHGGQIWAESEPGRGTLFHITVATDPLAVPGYGRTEDTERSSGVG